MRKNILFQKLGLIVFTAFFTASSTACTAKLNKNTSVKQNLSTVIHVVEDTINSISDEEFKNPTSIETHKEDIKESIESCGYNLQEVTLVRVVDGDTIVVNIEGEETKVRLIGINTPESVASQDYLDRTGKENTAEGKQASEWVKDLLKDYPTLYLQKDTSETDRYGRTLRYVWLEVPTDCDNIKEIQSKMLNGILLENGLAEVTIYKPDTKYADVFQAIYTHTTDDFEIDR